MIMCACPAGDCRGPTGPGRCRMTISLDVYEKIAGDPLLMKCFEDMRRELAEANAALSNSRIPEFAHGWVTVQIRRMEGYEDVAPDLVMEDAIANPTGFWWRLVGPVMPLPEER
jgi:hypothetical protein